MARNRTRRIRRRVELEVLSRGLTVLRLGARLGLIEIRHFVLSFVKRVCRIGRSLRLSIRSGGVADIRRSGKFEVDILVLFTCV